MWGTVGQVSTGLALVAFMVAAAVSAYRAHLRHRIKILETLPPPERSIQLGKELNAFGIQADNLTTTQQFKLAVHELNLRSRKLLAWSIVIVVITLMCGAIALFALLGSSESSKALSAYRSELAEVEESIEIETNMIRRSTDQRNRHLAMQEEYEKQVEKNPGKQQHVDYYAKQVEIDGRSIQDMAQKRSNLQRRRRELQSLISKYEQANLPQGR